MGDNFLNEFWDKLGYKRVLLAFLFAFGIIPPGIGIVFVRKPALFETLGMSKIIALSIALGMPFIVSNIFLGIVIAYLFYYKKQNRKNIHEDKIARLTLSSGLITSSISTNALLISAYIFTNCKLVDIGKIIFVIDVILYILFQVLLLCKVGIFRSNGT